MQRLYKPEDLAAALSLKPGQVMGLVPTGHLKGYMIGNELRIGEQDLDQSLEACVVGRQYEDMRRT